MGVEVGDGLGVYGWFFLLNLFIWMCGVFGIGLVC